MNPWLGVGEPDRVHVRNEDAADRRGRAVKLTFTRFF